MDRKKVQNKAKGWIYGATWANYPCEARAVSIVVGLHPPDWWCATMAGEERRAVEVTVTAGGDKERFYVDNEDGTALNVFLKGLAPIPKFRFVNPFAVKDDPKGEVFYKVNRL